MYPYWQSRSHRFWQINNLLQSGINQSTLVHLQAWESGDFNFLPVEVFPLQVNYCPLCFLGHPHHINT